MFAWFQGPAVLPKRKFAWKRGHFKLSDAWHSFENKATDLPASIDLREKLPPIYDQGELGSCVSNSVSFAVQFDLMNNNLTLADPSNKVDTAMKSRLFLYYNCRVLDNSVDSDAGTSIHSAVQALTSLGIPDESVWSYSP